MLLTERRFYYRCVTNSLWEVAKKVVYRNSTGSNESRNVKSTGLKALYERYTSRSTLYIKINRG
jgi:hypothetical protein